MLPTEITLCYISGDVHQKWECDLFTSQLENLQYPFFTYKPQSPFLRIICTLVVHNSIITQMIRKYFQLQEHFTFTHTSITLLLSVFLFACLPNASLPSISSSDDTSSVLYQHPPNSVQDKLLVLRWYLCLPCYPYSSIIIYFNICSQIWLS